MKGKWIVVDKNIYQKLKDLAKPGETFSATIQRLAEAYETYDMASNAQPSTATKEETKPSIETKPAWDLLSSILFLTSHATSIMIPAHLDWINILSRALWVELNDEDSSDDDDSDEENEWD